EMRPSPDPSLCPYTTLFRSRHRIVVAELHRVGALPAGEGLEARLVLGHLGERHEGLERGPLPGEGVVAVDASSLGGEVARDVAEDRKSTRLNSSHQIISTAG